MSEDLPYMNSSLELEERIDDLMKHLTFDDKVLLIAGAGHNRLAPIPRLNIMAFGMTDGPHGVSPGSTPEGNATYFPTGIQMASTWNPELLYEFGQAAAEEVRAVDRHMFLGPAINIARDPMNGRTFEYYAEDPYLAGELVVQSVKGVQSKRISTCVKHYVANNYETNRFKTNANIPERALREIYLPAFKKAAIEGGAWSFMSAYNQINGTFVSEDKRILREILKEEWDSDAVVVSDWGATNHTSGIKALIEAGLDIEMGSRNIYDIEKMNEMHAAGEIPEEYFDDNIKRILRVMFRVGIFDEDEKIPEGHINTKEHQMLARKMAEEGMILLKNDDGLLPLDDSKIKRIAILGKHADTKFGRKSLGGGSSAVHPPYEITVRDGLEKRCKGKIEIVDDAAEADVAIVCVGLEHSHDFKGGDHEGTDRLRYSLGILQPRLINKTVEKNPNTIVVCINGSPFSMEKFIDNVPAILEAWYGGMEVGTAVAEILFGDINPSGKLPVSWPKTAEDIPTKLSLWQKIIKNVKDVEYEEGVFVGYRYYDKYNVDLDFCFGHGLSYTTFDYANLNLSSDALSQGGTITVSFDVENTGTMAGAEISQLYIQDVKSSVPRPIKELKGFKKVFMAPGTSENISLEIKPEDLAYFDEDSNDWKIEPGKFKVLIGKSSRDIELEAEFEYTA